MPDYHWCNKVLIKDLININSREDIQSVAACKALECYIASLLHSCGLNTFVFMCGIERFRGNADGYVAMDSDVRTWTCVYSALIKRYLKGS